MTLLKITYYPIRHTCEHMLRFRMNNSIVSSCKIYSKKERKGQQPVENDIAMVNKTTTTRIRKKQMKVFVLKYECFLL